MALYPLESNPEVLNKFIHSLGIPEKYQIVDVYGIDNDALAWVPRPVIALILLFPCSDKYYEYCKQEKQKIDSTGQNSSPNLWFMKQYVSNACGTVALIHSIANNTDRIPLKDGVFKKLLDESKGKTPEEKGQLLTTADSESEAFKLISAHQELAMEGQTQLNPDEKVNHHFVALIEKDGDLYEMDGRKDYPINHGGTTKEKFLYDAAKVCREFMERDAEDINFTILALTETEES